MIFVINKDFASSFRKKIDSSIAKHCEVVYVYQTIKHIPTDFERPPDRSKPWGTAHALLTCKNFVDSLFVVINADDFYGRSAYKIIFNFLGQNHREVKIPEYSIVGYILNKTLTEHGSGTRGICDIDENGMLCAVHERTSIKRFGDQVKSSEDGKNWITITNKSIVSMNMWGFTRHIFAELEDRFRLFLKYNTDNLLEAEFFLPAVVNDLLLES